MICRTVACQRRAQDHSPYCRSCVDDIIHRAFAPTQLAAPPVERLSRYVLPVVTRTSRSGSAPRPTPSGPESTAASPGGRAESVQAARSGLAGIEVSAGGR